MKKANIPIGLPRNLTRRRAVKLAATSAALPLVHIRNGRGAGRVSIAFWDHSVPSGNAVMQKRVEARAATNQIEVQADFITAVEQKTILTIAAEAQAKTGHDIQAFSTWDVHNNAEFFEPVDDIMKRLSHKYGPINEVWAYLAKIKGHWLAVPTRSGTQYKGPCGRISVLKDKARPDVVGMYLAKPGHVAAADNWTWDAHYAAAETCANAGMPFASGLGQTTDSGNAAVALPRAFGAELVDKDNKTTVKSDKVRAVPEHRRILVKVLSEDAARFDDASNNRALISGKSALIWNPPSPLAVAKRDAPQVAADRWSFSAPAGPAGRFLPYLPYFCGVWSFSKNKSAAKDLIEALPQHDPVQQRCDEVIGYDVPLFTSMLDFKVWDDVEPPKSTVYNYPLRPFHSAKPYIAGLPALPEIAVQIYDRRTMPTMLTKLKKWPVDRPGGCMGE